MTQVVVVIGAGSIGQAIARRVSAGKHVLLADLRVENAEAAAFVFRDTGSTSRQRPSTSPTARRSACNAGDSNAESERVRPAAFYSLHAWVLNRNPAGAFAVCNSAVRC